MGARLSIAAACILCWGTHTQGSTSGRTTSAHRESPQYAPPGVPNDAQAPWEGLLTYLVQGSSVVVWGRVTQTESYWQSDERGRHIYTEVQIDPLGSAVGQRPQTPLILEVKGGTAEGVVEWVSGVPGFQEHEEVVLFLTGDPYGLVGGDRGKLSIYDGKVYWRDQELPLATFMEAVELIALNQSPVTVWYAQANPSGMVTFADPPTITTISPSTASAGTETQVTITGTNFGSTQGTGKVEFFYRSGKPKISAPISSWSETQIVCEVPVDTIENYAASAGSGPVTVTTPGGTSNGKTFSVSFGNGRFKWPGTTPQMEFYVHENTSDAVGEGAAVQRAAGTWNAVGTPFSFQYKGSHSNLVSNDNNKNEILWGDVGNALTLAQTHLWHYVGTDELAECDIVFNDDHMWSTSASVPAGQHDVETVALHEMGHCLSLRDLYGPSGDSQKVMYGLSMAGAAHRNLHSDDKAGIRWIYSPPCTLPAAPSGAAATDGTHCDRIRVSWNPVSGAAGYEIWRGTSSNMGAAVKIADDTSSPYDDTSAHASGTVYTYAVKARNACGVSALSAADSGYRSSVPAAPTGIWASDGTYSDRIRIGWNPVDNASAGYEVWRGAGSDASSSVKIAHTASSPFDDTAALPSGTLYHYRVKAKNDCGTSALSVSDSGYRYLAIVPLAPTDVSATNGTYCDRVRVSWNSVSGASGYEIWRGMSSSPSSAVKIADVVSSPFFDMSASSLGTVYFYSIKAKSGTGTSGFSASDSGYRGTPPPAPTDVSATDGTHDQKIQVSWHPVPGATRGYEIWRGTSPSPAAAVRIASTASGPYDDVLASPSGTVYHYFVRAENICGTSGFSASDSGHVRGGQGGAILYVDTEAPEGGDGRSWSSAFQSLQNALTAASDSGGMIQEIRVAAGTYRPPHTEHTPSRILKATFRLINGVTLKGGYAGPAMLPADPNTRDIRAHETIMSGDVRPGTEPWHERGSVHVVTGSDTDSSAVLDGFTIMSGGVKGMVVSSQYGAGLHVVNGSPTITNCTFFGNDTRGTTAFDDAIHPMGYGGAVYVENSESHFVNCQFKQNSADYGGAVYSQSSRCVFVNCLFAGNASQWGGGLALMDEGTTSLLNCTFAQNTAAYGSAFNCGVAPSDQASSVVLSNAILWDDDLEIWNANGSPVMVTFSNLRGGLAMTHDPLAGITWGLGNMNADPAFVQLGYWGDIMDPELMVEPANPNAVWVEGDYHLQLESPCINTGDSTALPLDGTDLDEDSNTSEPLPLDLDNGERIIEDVVDVGAYERQ